MLPELMGKDGGVEPVEGEVPAVDHVDQRLEDLRLLPDLVAEAVLLAAFDEVESLHRARLLAAARLHLTQLPAPRVRVRLLSHSQQPPPCRKATRYSPSPFEAVFPIWDRRRPKSPYPLILTVQSVRGFVCNDQSASRRAFLPKLSAYPDLNVSPRPVILGRTVIGRSEPAAAKTRVWAENRAGATTRFVAGCEK